VDEVTEIELRDALDILVRLGLADVTSGGDQPMYRLADTLSPASVDRGSTLT
jgi:hypothetical protein